MSSLKFKTIKSTQSGYIQIPSNRLKSTSKKQRRQLAKTQPVSLRPLCPKQSQLSSDITANQTARPWILGTTPKTTAIFTERAHSEKKQNHIQSRSMKITQNTNYIIYSSCWTLTASSTFVATISTATSTATSPSVAAAAVPLSDGISAVTDSTLSTAALSIPSSTAI